MTAASVQDGRPLAQRRALLLGALALAVAAAVGGSWLAWMCDDAYIAFRYVSNAHDGRGLVWNPAPFEPVEGYTCFSWVVLLWAVWSWFGVAPPDAANGLSIAFGVGLVLVTASAAARVRDRRGQLLPVWCVLAAVLCVAGNRTSLNWFTSGLETALFNLAFVSWVFEAFRSDAPRATGRLVGWSSLAALAALTRPDGLLLVAATGAAAALGAMRRERSWGETLRGLAPLVAVAAHLAWRKATYGEWLPNTYYAKVTTAWPEAGLRYLACFVVEQGAWIWALVLGGWAVAALARGAGAALRLALARAPACAAVGAVLFHVGYYCLRVGGDPFEYRVLSYLIPLGAVATLAAGARCMGAIPGGASAVAVALAATLGWGHLYYHQPSVLPFYQPIADQVPAPLHWLARWHDRQMAWLKPQVLCGRPRVHALWLEEARARLPLRQRTTFDAADVPVMRERGVGLPGWTLPDVAVLDEHGLNDWVVARSPKGGAQSFPVSGAQLEAVFASLPVDADGRYARADMTAALAALADPRLARGLVDFLLLQLAPPGAATLAPSELAGLDGLLQGLRFMAHERLPPAGYLEDFAPNVQVQRGEVSVTPRQQPLSAERIRALEAAWRERTLRRKPD